MQARCCCSASGLNVTAGLGALGFAWIEDRIGPRTTVLMALAALTGLSVVVLLVTSPLLFWVFGLTLGLFIGPSQAASRSLMAAMAPAEARGAWFGLFALSGRITALFGPLALGLVTAWSGSQRAGMAVIPVFLLVGAVLLLGVPSPAPERRPPG